MTRLRPRPRPVPVRAWLHLILYGLASVDPLPARLAIFKLLRDRPIPSWEGGLVKFCAQRLLRRARWLPFAPLVVTWDDLDGACNPCANRPCSRQDGISNSVVAQGGGRFMREWQYWTRNKLSILAGYLPAFNVASKRSPERLYIDLMAGEPFNRDKKTGEEFDGSARLALSCTPPFTRIALCEMPQKAAALEKGVHSRGLATAPRKRWLRCCDIVPILDRLNE